MSWLKGLLQADKNIFVYFQQHAHSTVADAIMPYLRNSNTWFPLYIFLLVVVLLNGNKNKYYWLLFAIVVVVAANFVSSDLIKKNIFRVRPCNDFNVMRFIPDLLGYKPQNSSFTSSHACNHFAMAAFFHFTLKSILPATKWFFVWAVAICIAQVYVGVHYPLDVFCGAVVGFCIGFGLSKQFNKRFLSV
jgi:membrane-associated phospholipid phosphatase